jgi:glycosyltransferase involved in cell wall biosynthesis
MVADWRPDVAHFHSVMGHLSLSVLVELNRLGIPVVWTLHDYKLLCPNTHLTLRGAPCDRCRGGRYVNCLLNRCKKDSAAASLVAMLEAETARFIDPAQRVAAFIAPSRFLLNTFGEFGWDTSNFVHLPNFAPDDDIPVRRSPEGQRFLYVGRLDPEKGVATLLNAVGAAPDVRLDIAGDGPLREELQALARRVAGGRATFHGIIGPGELARLRDRSVATIVPSECHENSPYAVTEAFSRGCPAIAARTGGLPEIVVDEETGLLFEPGDATGLAWSMRRLAGDPGLQTRLSNGARKAADGLGIDEYAPRIVDVYRSVLAS